MIMPIEHEDSMEINIQQHKDITVITLYGELNSQTSTLAQEQLSPLVMSGCKIVIDLGAITYMSSAGLRTLLLLYRQINNAQGQFVVTNLTEMVHDTMQITGFLDFFDTYPDINSGLAALES